MNEPGIDPMSAASSVVQFGPPDVAHRHLAEWNGIQADTVEIVSREPYEYGFKASHHLLIMSEHAQRDEGETLIEGLPKSTLREFSHKLSLVPAGHQFFGWIKPRTSVRVTYFYIDPRGPSLDPELGFADTEFKPRLFFFDKDLWETAAKLKSLSQNSNPGERQYAEALSIVLAHELLRLNNNNGVVHKQEYVRGGLAGWQQKKVAQYIEEHLLEDIPLAQLAQVARLSPYHFVRAFKQSFGLPPHRYLSKLRMDEAKALLADPARSVTQIGVNLGFSETSSFTTAFRKHTGVTPTAYRRSLQ
jgi:AraC-like DNA-binding protein